MARILYIDHYVGSLRHGMEFRPFYLAREWQKSGHEVTLLGASFSHLRQPNPAVTQPVSEEVIDGVRYLWLATPAYSGNGFGRVRNMLAFVARLRAAERRLIAMAPQVVIASSTHPFDIFSARRIARATGARLIFELHDLWPLSPMEIGGMSRWHPFIMVTQFAEDYVCRHADAVVSLLPKAADHLSSRGLAPGKFHYIPNGIAREDWALNLNAPLPAQHAQLIQRVRARGDFLMLYAGGHSTSNHLGVLLAAAEQLRNAPISIVLVGEGLEKAHLQKRADDAQLERVHFLPGVPKAAVPALLSAADALVLSFAPHALYRFGVSPNKLMDYMMAAKPILAAMRAGNNPVEEHRCGFTVAPDNPAALAEAARRLQLMPAAELAAMGVNGRRAVEECYAYDVLAKQFARHFT